MVTRHRDAVLRGFPDEFDQRMIERLLVYKWAALRDRLEDVGVALRGRERHPW